MILIKQLPLIALIMSLISACSSDIEHSERHPVSSKFLKVTGSVGAISRATANSWEANDRIGISGGESENIEYCTQAGTETFTAVNAESAIQIEPNATTEFTAYYPYSSSANIEIPVKVTDDNNKYTSKPAEIDFMFAKSKAANGAVNFEFKHKMTKINLKLVIKYIDENNALTEKPADMEEITSTDVTISNIPVSGSFNRTTGFIQNGQEALGTIKTAVTTGGTELIVPPYSGLTNDIVIKATFGDKEYTANIKPALEAGYQYSYTLTYNVKIEPEKPTTTTMSISQASIAAWTDVNGGNVDFNAPEGAVGGGDPVTPEVGKKVAAVGDYILKDGTILPAGDFDKATHKDQVAAVVFYVAENQEELGNLGFPFHNGLAIGLNTYDDKLFASQTGLTLNNFNRFAKDNPEWTEIRDYWNVYNNSLQSTESLPSKFTGYAQTELYKYTIEKNRFYPNNDENSIEATNKIDGLKTALSAVEKINSNEISSWYLPSFAEFKEIEKQFATLDRSIIATGGTFEFTDNITYGGFHWTSDEFDVSKQWVWAKGLNEKVIKSNTNGRFRFAVCF